MADKGWIKLHRSVLEWEWYKDTTTKIVFLHLLLTALYSDGGYRGDKLKPGQCIIGRKALAKQLGIGEQQVRTALNHLKSTNEITIEPTNKYSIVTIVNWHKYQELSTDSNQQDNHQVNQQLTNNQPTTNQQLTTFKEIRKKEIKNKNYSLPVGKEEINRRSVEILAEIEKGNY